MTMSHGTGISAFGKQALVPRSFISICAFDGQRASVGRVVTDATWHHFVNINLDGTGTSPAKSGLQIPGAPPTDSPELTRIRHYYGNLANWLMPSSTRRCLRFVKTLVELSRFPLYEELEWPPKPGPGPGPGPDPSPLDLVKVGDQLLASLATRLPAWQVEAMALDGLAEAIGDQAAQGMIDGGAHVAGLAARDLALAAVGAITASVVETLGKLGGLEELAPHKTFEAPAQAAARAGVRRMIESKRKELLELGELLGKVAVLEAQ
jgi:hypothetical protein